MSGHKLNALRKLLVVAGVIGLAVAAPATASAGVPECFGQPATIVGTPGNDPDLDGTAGDDVIVGRGGNDHIDGMGGNDRICGGPSAVSPDPYVPWYEGLTGGPGQDRLSGGGGPDGLHGGPDDDVLRGGAGRDLATYSDAPGSVIVDLAAGTAIGAAGDDSLEEIDDITGTHAYADDLRGDAGPNTINGSGHADIIYGRAGDDFLRGWLNGDELRGGAGADALWGGWGPDADDDDELYGGGGDDILRPDADPEIPNFNYGNGDDEINGGSGRDLLSFDKVLDSVDVDLLVGTVTGQGSDDVARVEDVTGGEDHDDFTGDDGPNAVQGGTGSDVFSGLGGDDFFDAGEDGGAGSGGEGNDRIVGGSAGGGPGRDVLIGTDANEGFSGGGGRDVIRAKGGEDTIEDPTYPEFSAGTDRINAGAGFDTVYPILGRDVVKGGPDVDTLFYGGGPESAIEVDLAAGTVTGGVEQEVPGFEYVFGTAYDDVLRGTDGPNELRGLIGNDRLFGRDGDDLLLGGADEDDFFGGAGDDECDHFAAEDGVLDSCTPVGP